MSRIKSLLAAVAGTVLLTLATPAFAQYKPWPAPMPEAPKWGDYDSGHTWRDAAWWWQSQPEWVKQHHPEWWGDFDNDHQWHPAWWWWNSQPGVGSRASPRMVGRLLPGQLVPGDVVVSVSAGMGARASSGMVGQ